MFKERTNSYSPFSRPLSGFVALTLLVTGCQSGSDNSETVAEKDRSEQLLNEVKQAKETGDFARVVILCDSIDKTFPDMKDARKTALGYWTEAQLALLQDTASQLDTQIRSITKEMTQLMPEFVQKNMNGIEDYRIIKTVDTGSIVGKTAVQPRLGSEDDLWTLVVNVNGVHPSITGMRLVLGDNHITEVLAQNPENRRATETSGEMFSFSAEEAGPVAEALSEGQHISGRLDIVGIKRTVSIPLNQTMIDAIVKTWKMARLREDRQTVLKKRELTERKIEVMKKRL